MRGLHINLNYTVIESKYLPIPEPKKYQQPKLRGISKHIPNCITVVIPFHYGVPQTFGTPE